MTGTTTDNPLPILLVEDSPTDVMMTREAMEYCGLRHPLHVAEDGMEAMAFLRQEGRYEGAPRPGLIILDLNLPRMSGREVLEAPKADPALRQIPVVVLTISK